MLAVLHLRKFNKNSVAEISLSLPSNGVEMDKSGEARDVCLIRQLSLLVNSTVLQHWRFLLFTM